MSGLCKQDFFHKFCSSVTAELVSRISDRLVTFSPHNSRPNVMDASARDARMIGSVNWNFGC